MKNDTRIEQSSSEAKADARGILNLNDFGHPGKPFFVSIVPVRNRMPEQVAAEIEEQHRLSGLKNFAVIFPLQPQGERPLDKAEYDAAMTNLAIKTQVGIDIVRKGHEMHFVLNYRDDPDGDETDGAK